MLKLWGMISIWGELTWHLDANVTPKLENRFHDEDVRNNS